jgi:predicted nucleotidyltransferase
MQDETRRIRLEQFLAPHGYHAESLLQEVENVFGEPELVSATGSVLSGFGNATSDVDLMVVVPRVGLHDLPILSFPKHLRVDSEYYGSQDVQDQVTIVRDQPWPPRQRISRSIWVKYWRALRIVTRLEGSFPLKASPAWSDRVASLSGDWLRSQVSNWWYHEALRLRIAAQWAQPRNPLLAQLRMSDALLCALHGEVSQCGELILHKKWLPEKLKAAGLRQHLQLFEFAISSTAGTVMDEEKYARLEREVDSILAHGLGQSRVSIQLRLSDGTKVINVPGGILVSQWDMEGMYFEGTPCVIQNDLVFQGSVFCKPSREALELWDRGMCWCGLISEEL